jgi:hypothetical protein
VNPLEASDSGARIVDHALGDDHRFLEGHCSESDSTSLRQCQAEAKQFIRNGTWLAPTMIAAHQDGDTGARAKIYARFNARARQFWADSLPPGNWLHDAASVTSAGASDLPFLAGQFGRMRIAQQTGLPILAGTDVIAEANPWFIAGLAGFGLHAELALYVMEGLTPLSALQSATLNPAKMLHATDSLGTVAPGKLADLVLLDADPLTDITNTTTIRVVVANGRYFDRTTLDQVLASVRATKR